MYHGFQNQVSSVLPVTGHEAVGERCDFTEQLRSQLENGDENTSYVR